MPFNQLSLKVYSLFDLTVTCSLFLRLINLKSLLGRFIMSRTIKKKELELYELILLFKFTSTEDLADKLENYKTFLTDRGSQVMIKNHGTTSLPYSIKGFDTATHVQIVCLGNGELIKQINVELQRDESILRTIITKSLPMNF